MPKTITIREDIFSTGSVACDFKEIREFYRTNLDTFIKAYDEIKKILKVKNSKMIFRNLRKAHGKYIHAQNEIAIDIRCFDVKSIVSTIIHEMTHAQQYETKKMVCVNNKDVVFAKKEYKRIDSNKNIEGYRNQPWEIEARKNEEKYIEKVMKAIS